MSPRTRTHVAVILGGLLLAAGLVVVGETANATDDGTCDESFEVTLPDTYRGRPYFWGSPGDVIDLGTFDVPDSRQGADGYPSVVNGESTHGTVLVAESATVVSWPGVEAVSDATWTAPSPVVLGPSLSLSIVLDGTRASLAGSIVTVCTTPDPEPSETPSHTSTPTPTGPSSTPTPEPTPSTSPSRSPSPTPSTSPSSPASPTPSSPSMDSTPTESSSSPTDAATTIDPSSTGPSTTSPSPSDPETDPPTGTHGSPSPPVASSTPDRLPETGAPGAVPLALAAAALLGAGVWTVARGRP